MGKREGQCMEMLCRGSIGTEGEKGRREVGGGIEVGEGRRARNIIRACTEVTYGEKKREKRGSKSRKSKKE